MVKISVCIATYNGERYIKEQLNSILPQLGPHDEVVISDDSSTDKTVELIRSYNDSRIKLFEGVKFRSHIKNFEFALSKAVGDFIFMSDQDDIWISNKVKVCLEILKSFDLVLSDCILINDDKKEIAPSYFKIRASKPGLLKNFYKNSYTGCCMAFNKMVLKKSLPFPQKIISHDTWIGLVAEMYGKTKFIEQPLIYLRRHQNNFSVNAGNDALISGESSYKLNQIFKHRIYLLYNLLKRFITI